MVVLDEPPPFVPIDEAWGSVSKTQRWITSPELLEYVLRVNKAEIICYYLSLIM